MSYRQTAQTGFKNFIQRVQSSYDDTIVRPRFENEQLPLILNFAETVTSKVYNQTFFETSFDGMRDAIVESYGNETNDVFIQDSKYRDAILNLLKKSFVRQYAPCLNELVSESQEGRNLLTSKYTYCLDERTTSITVVIPSTSSWLSVIRDNVNFILNQLNACLNGQISVAGRTATSDCIQSVSSREKTGGSGSRNELNRSNGIIAVLLFISYFPHSICSSLNIFLYLFLFLLPFLFLTFCVLFVVGLTRFSQELDF